MSPLPPTRERPAVFVPPGTPYLPGLPGPGGEPPRRGRRVLKLLFFAFAIGLAVVLGMLAAGAYITKQEIDDLLTPKTAAVQQAQKQLEAPLPNKPANVLVLGSDFRKTLPGEGKRSDTMLLVRLDPARETVSMLSFPRDLWVSIPGVGERKINDAYSEGGPALAVQTVKELTGVDVHYIVNVDFRGFRGIVDQLGGVYVDVDQRYLNDRERGGGNYAEIDLQPGYQLLRGRDALDFARYRHKDSDFHRIARQQLLLAELKKQVGASQVARNVPGLFKVVKNNTDMAAGGDGDVSVGQVVDYMRLALKLSGDNVYQVELVAEPGQIGEASVVLATDAAIQDATKQFLEPDEQARDTTVKRIAGEAGGAKADEEGGSELPPPSRITVEVRNGNGIPGAARGASGVLRGLGYQVQVQQGAAGNADNQNYASTRIQYNAERFKPVAERLAESFEGATVEKSTSANPFNTRLLVIVGKTGVPEGGAGATGETPSRVPPKAAPKVTTDPEYGVDDFQAATGAVKFPVLYPAVREQTSTYQSLDDGGTVRAYQIPKGQSVYQAYRAVLVTSTGDYWGIQGTNWPDPPILEDPTREVQRGGRTYRLYFNGTKLHMVSWREAGGTYWISNSVLDKLSNETMMAIAEGARRAPR